MAIGKEIWILACGRLLTSIGSGFTAFYAPIFYVNTVGLKPGVIGLGLGAGGIAGMIARVISGSVSDGSFGRKRTTLLAIMVLAAGAFTLAISTNFVIFLIGAMLMGCGTGLYWPASQAFIADKTEDAALNEAYGMTFLCDFIGLSLGVLLGGLLINFGGDYRTLFVIDGLSCLLFFAVVYFGLTDPKTQARRGNPWEGWEKAVHDWRLKVYVCFNLLFTSYVIQVETTLPLFFKNFIHYQTEKGFPSAVLCGLFSEYVVLMALLQMPVAKRFGSHKRTRVLMSSAVLMLVGFVLVWLAAICPDPNLILASSIVAMAAFAISLVLYGPAAAALVSELAPPDARGVYQSVNSLCWGAGAAIGAPIGLAALDLPEPWTEFMWLVFAVSVLLALALMLLLDSRMLTGSTPLLAENQNE